MIWSRFRTGLLELLICFSFAARRLGGTLALAQNAADNASNLAQRRFRTVYTTATQRRGRFGQESSDRFVKARYAYPHILLGGKSK